MRHHGEVPAVPGAEPGHAPGGAVGVQGVLLGGVPLVVQVADRGEAARDDGLLSPGATELHQTCKKRGREEEKGGV